MWLSTLEIGLVPWTEALSSMIFMLVPVKAARYGVSLTCYQAFFFAEGGGRPLKQNRKRNAWSQIRLKFYVIAFESDSFAGFFRIGVWKAGLRALRKDIVWDLKGEGRILGGVFVIGPGEQGILLDHVAKDFGDEVDPKDVMTAVERIKYYSTEKSQL